nr:DUF2946 domain-containing protein [Pseudomonas brassicacearum subsp. brassicacearum]
MSLTRGSWISLFAMLMIFIGPLISQSMPMGQGMSMPVSMDMNMEMSMDMSAHEAPAAEHCPPQSEHHALWEKNAAIAACCSIAPHCLAVTPSRSSTHPRPTPTPAFSPRLGHARPASFPGARTRAPPLDA